jgi:hypothetical protein
MGRKRALGRGLDEIFAEQDAYNKSRGSRSDGLDRLIPNSRNINADTDFGVGYEIVDPAPTRGLDPRGPRAKKMGYNSEEEYLVIIMRDNSKIGYPGVSSSTWNNLSNYESTTDYIEYELAGNTWTNLRGQLPPQTS